MHKVSAETEARAASKNSNIGVSVSANVIEKEKVHSLTAEKGCQSKPSAFRLALNSALRFRSGGRMRVGELQR